jgi:hypothetical protein
LAAPRLKPYCSSYQTPQKTDIETAAPRLKPLVLGKTALPKTSGFRRGASSRVSNVFLAERGEKKNRKRSLPVSALPKTSGFRRGAASPVSMFFEERDEKRA